jgi:cytochrome c551/c552
LYHQDIAKKYGDKPKLEGALISQIMYGSPSSGGNHWGTMKMPGAGARPQVNVAEANQLLDWILSLK